MNNRIGFLIMLAVPMSTGALAEPQAYRLSQAEIDATIAAASHRAETSSLLPFAPVAPLSLPNLPPAGAFPMTSDRKIHGIAGVSVDSLGGYSLFSSTAIPIGQDSFASFSFSYSRIPGANFFPYDGLSPIDPRFRR